MSNPTIETVTDTGSTSADLLARIAKEEPVEEGCWLVADRQHGGRGRQGRPWLDAPGNFMGSTVVHLNGDEAPLTTLPFVAALAVYETALPRLSSPHLLTLKWPNDVLLGGAKLAGILLERASEFAVIGIGVNLTAGPFLSERRTGYLASAGPAPERDRFAADLAFNFETELGRWRYSGATSIIERWLAAAHPIGASLTIHAADGSKVTGKFAGLEPDGALRLRMDGSGFAVIYAGDVALEGGTP